MDEQNVVYVDDPYQAALKHKDQAGEICVGNFHLDLVSIICLNCGKEFRQRRKTSVGKKTEER
ncbi:hypothetical protein KKG19_02570 [Patescibacteria group bacterium]|nr:hypothetical protein [Patescibacteria group bacterium]